MSKSINLLKTAQVQQSSKYSAALNKADNSGNLTVNSRALNSKKAVWPLTLFFAIIFLLILVLNAALFISVQKPFSKLKTFQDSINNNTKHIVTLVSSFQQTEEELKKVNLRFGDENKKISQLEKLSDANAAAIENLTRAKNTLFSRASALEVELNKLKSVNNQELQ